MTEPTAQPVETQVVPTQPTAVPQVVTTDKPVQAPAVELFEGEPFDPARAKALIEKLRAENKELKPKAKQADELSKAEEERKQAEMTELQKLTAKLEKAEIALKTEKLNAWKRQACTDAGLPLVFADRLQGETQEQLTEDAKKLLEALPKPTAVVPAKPTPPPVSPTNPGPGASQGETLAQQRARIYGTGVDPLDANYAKQHGGGVIWKEKQG